MRWSKLKQLVEESFVESLDGRLRINSTTYGHSRQNRVWITYDGEVIANFSPEDQVSSGLYPEDQIETNSGKDAHKACWDFVHDIAIADAIVSQDPLIQSLAIVDKRLGKRRIESIDISKIHPLAAKLLEIRKQSEREKTHSV